MRKIRNCLRLLEPELRASRNGLRVGPKLPRGAFRAIPRAGSESANEARDEGVHSRESAKAQT
eukprot:11800936-Alexandrium_andersonii.AAC.1